MLRTTFVVLLIVLFTSVAYSQGEYTKLGDNAVALGAAGQWHDKYNAYGLFLGGVKNGVFDGNVHFLLGKDRSEKIQQYGLQVSAYIGRRKDKRNPFGAIRLTFDNVSGSGQIIDPGHTAFALSLHLIWVSSNTARVAAVPSIGAAYVHFFGDLAPAESGQFSATIGLKFTSRRGKVFVIEPGLTLADHGENKLGAVLTLGFFFPSKSLTREVWRIN